MREDKITLVLGASKWPHRYSYLAAEKLLKNDYEIVLVGKSESEIFNHKIVTKWPKNINIDTITVYLSAQNQTGYYDNILNSGARRIIFNPGAENAELARLAKDKGIFTEEACTLVLLSTEQY